ncbi:hypothetical protein HYV89_05265 [Candidatus Woesearchaeota archaeon]|nr:hypothetical protein [Candidatus Woesearchaeota archaeon]
MPSLVQRSKIKTLSKLLLILSTAAYFYGTGASHYYDRRQSVSEIVKKTYTLEAKIAGLDSTLKIESCNKDSIKTELCNLKKEHGQFMFIGFISSERKDYENKMKLSRLYALLAAISVLPLSMGIGYEMYGKN